MPTTKYYITETPHPASAEVAAAAEAVGAAVILHGIPASLADVIPAGTLGGYTVTTPDPPPFPPLDATGALATLLVVEGVLLLSDAAAALHEEEAHLIHEAEAWEVAS